MSAVLKMEKGADPETAGMRELLLTLPEFELANILKSVTGTLVQFGSVPRDENGRPKTDKITHAVNSILMYGDAISLLNKQKMKKAYLAEYLNQKGVRMTVPPTKNSLARDVLDYWGQAVPDNLRIIDDETPRRARTSQNSRSSVQSSQNGAIQSSSRDNQASGVSHLPSSQAEQSAVPSHQPDSNAISVAQQSSHHNELSRCEYEAAVSLRQREADLGQQLGKEFSAWYYERLNTLTDFNVSHFWAECNFRLEIIFAAQPGNTLIEEIMGDGEATCAKIKDLVCVKTLRFIPNADTGIRGYLNPHGLAQVIVCGTIYLRDGNGSSVGIFEQMFGLMKDPRAGNNFKIKFSVLRMREGAYLAVNDKPPELCDSSLVGIVEEIDDDAEFSD